MKMKFAGKLSLFILICACITTCLIVYFIAPPGSGESSVFKVPELLGKKTKYSEKGYEDAYIQVKIDFKTNGNVHNRTVQIAAQILNDTIKLISGKDPKPDPTELIQNIKQLRESLNNGNIKNTDIVNIINYHIDKCDKLLKFASEFREYETGKHQNTNNIQLYSNFLEDRNEVCFWGSDEFKISSIVIIKLTQSRSAQCDIIKTPRDKTRPIYSYMDLEEVLNLAKDKTCPRIIRDSAISEYREHLPLAKTDYPGQDKYKISELEKEIDRLRALPKEDNFPQLNDFHATRIAFLASIISSVEGSLKTSSFDPSSIKLTNSNKDDGMSVKFIKKLEVLADDWKNQTIKEDNISTPTLSAVSENIKVWEGIKEKAPIDKIETYIEKFRFAIWQKLNDAIGENDKAKSWESLALLRGKYFQDAPTSWRKFLHYLRRSKFIDDPARLPEQGDRLCKEAEELKDQGELEWATNMKNMLLSIDKALKVKSLEELNLKSFDSPDTIRRLGWESGTEFYNNIDSVIKAKDEFRKQIASLADTYLKNSSPDEKDILISLDKLEKAASNTPWSDVAKSFKAKWVAIISGKTTSIEEISKAAEDKDLGKHYVTIAAVKLFILEKLKFIDLDNLKAVEVKIDNYNKFQKKLKELDQKLVARWFELETNAAPVLRDIVQADLAKVYKYDDRISNFRLNYPESWNDNTNREAWGNLNANPDLRNEIDEYIKNAKEFITYCGEYDEKNPNNVFTIDFLNEVQGEWNKRKDKIKSKSGESLCSDINEYMKFLAEEILPLYDEGKWDAAYSKLINKPVPSSNHLIAISRFHKDRLEHILKSKFFYKITRGKVFNATTGHETKKSRIGVARLIDISEAAYVGLGLSGTPAGKSNAKWDGNKHGKIEMIDNYFFKWTSDKNIDFKIYNDKNILLFEISVEGPNALRDFSAQIGISLQQLGFPYPWPSNFTEKIKPLERPPKPMDLEDQILNIPAVKGIESLTK